jgi:flagellar basal-body rod protein FlgF
MIHSVRQAPGIYRPANVLLSAQQAEWERLNAISDTLANAGTPGAKSSHVNVVSVEQSIPYGNGGASNMTYVDAKEIYRDFQDGPLLKTESELDFAIRGQGFFQVQSLSNEKVYYSRAGQFQLNANGELVTSRGDHVLDNNGSFIHFPAGVTTISVENNGSIFTNLGPNGKIGIKRFEHAQQMTPVGGNLYQTSQKAEDVVSPIVIQGAIEESNVNGITEIVRMIDASRRYDQIQKMIDELNDTSKRMINVNPRNA